MADLLKLLKFFPLIKVDDQTHRVWGLVTSETPDSDDEICDYAAAKADIRRWSDECLAKTTAAGQDPSLGNMRVMHQLEIGGKAVQIEYHDDQKQVWVGSEPANADVWHLLKGGFLTGHSIGGNYAWKKAEGKFTRYAPIISEISYVDKSANPDASFAYVKADGTTELRKFTKPGPEEEKLLAKLKANPLAGLSDEDVDRIVKALRGTLEKKTRYLVPEGEHLPVSDESGTVSHRLMGAAWAALHGGYRGNKYEGQDKAKALARLIALYHSEGIPLPSEKASGLLDELAKELASLGVAEFDTHLAKIADVIGEIAVQPNVTGEAEMNKDQIAKCAAALGIKVEEFETLFAAALDKGKGGLAALHSHLKKAVASHEKLAAHHAKMGEMHKAHGEMHSDHAEHLQDCMKAHGACMDGEEADKVLKALGVGDSSEFVSIGKTADNVEVFKRVAKAEKKEGIVEVKPDAAGMIKLEDVQKMLTDALAKQKKEFDEQLEKTVAPVNKEGGVVRLALVDREGKVLTKSEAANAAADPMPVS